MKVETVPKIVDVYREVEKENPDKSTEYILKMTADICNSRNIMHGCDISDVANALIESGVYR